MSAGSPIAPRAGSVPAVDRRRAWLAAAIAVGVVCVATAAQAHEIGTTTVTVHLRPAGPERAGAYRIDVVTDASALVEKLQSMSDARRSTPMSADTAAGLAALEGTFLGRVAVRFDDAVVRPDVVFAVAPPADDLSSSVATIRLVGDVPPGATRFSWSYGWTFASYALRVVEDGAEDGARQNRVELSSVEHRAAPTSVASAATQWLEGGESSTPYAMGIAAPPFSRAQVAAQYVWLGLTHIVPMGLDHVLFVLGLFLLSRRWRPLLWQVSAFTVAHSITLGLGMYGLVGAPPRIVEPLIALSIAYVAVENLLVSELKARRVALVFAFGLLHGLGFAGVLSELGLPRDAFAVALVGFNVGVEAGQLLVIAAAFALVGWSRAYPSYRQRVVLPASMAIACMAVYWTIERWPL